MPGLFLSSACDICMPQPKLPRAQTSWQTELAEDPCRIQPVPTPESRWHVSPHPLCWDHGVLSLLLVQVNQYFP